MIDLSIGDDGIAVITWNMADRSMNVLNADSMAAFADTVTKVIDDAGVKGVIITSAKDDFIAGADLFAMIQADDAQTIFDMCQGFHKLTRNMETCGKPFVAALPGTALGGGLEIALACHRRIAADKPKAQVGQPEVQVGLLPGGGGTQRLPRMIGARDALQLMVRGRKLSMASAKASGIIDEVVPADKLMEAAKAWLTDKPDASQPWDRKGYKIPGGGVWGPRAMETFVAGNAMAHAESRGNYPAVQAIMSCVYEGLLVDIDTGLRAEARWFTNLLLGPVAKNMMRSLFINMGAANKLASRPKDVPTAQYTKIGVLGAGMMGAGIAYVTAMAGLEVVLLDSEQKLAEKGKGYTEGLLAERVARFRMTSDERDKVLALIKPTTDFADLAGCEMVIEAVFEHRDIKADVTRKAEAVIGDDAVFASNTSTLPITGLAEASARPESFIGLHFFSPVDKMPLVEIIEGEKTSDECLAKAMDYVKRIRKTPIVVNDSRGFYTSRVFGTYVREGLAMIAEGVKPALIENAGKLAGMPVGPLGMSDEVSIELMHKVAQQTKADLGDAYITPPGEEGYERHGREARPFGPQVRQGLLRLSGNWPQAFMARSRRRIPVGRRTTGCRGSQTADAVRPGGGNRALS